MKFSYNWLQSYFPKKLPPVEKLAERLSDHLANVEEIQPRGTDFVLDIEIRPNRAADCLAHWGVALEIAAMLDIPLKLPSTRMPLEPNRAKDFVRLKVVDRKTCPRYSAAVLDGIEVRPSPVWLRQRLEACGLQSINNVVDAVNYVMLETNQPLHAFDLDRIESANPKSEARISPETRKAGNPKTIIVRFAQKGEKLLALDNKTYELDSDILVIADAKGPLAVAGIKGGQSSGIDQKTSRVVLEGANFNPALIRRASQQLNLKTDASWRFEHGLDPNLTEVALGRAVNLIREVAGGRIFSGLVDFYPRKRKPLTIKLEKALVSGLLGMAVSERQTQQILESLGFQVRKSKSFLLVRVPTKRMDVRLAEDLVEEVGRLLGYQNIKAQPPQVALEAPEQNHEIFWEEKTRDCLTQAGFDEVWNYSFLSANFKLPGLIRLRNPVDQHRPCLVPSLLPNLLNNVVENEPFFERLRIFELNKVFFLSRSGQPKEERRVALTAFGGSSESAILDELKGAIEFWLVRCGLPEFEWRAPGQALELRVAEIPAGSLKKSQTHGHVFLAEINFEKLLPFFSTRKTYQPLSKNPAARRDLSLLLPRQTSAREVRRVLLAGEVPHLVALQLFDVYRGPELGGDKKSLAFRLIFQSPQKSLSTPEIERSFEAVVRMAQSYGWVARKK